MGYNAKVTKTEFERWFSIWDWHRCLVLGCLGAEIIDEKEAERQLIMVSNLQYEGYSADPNDVESIRESIQDEVRFKIVNEGEPNIIHTHFDFDDEGHVVAGRAMVGLDFEPDEKFMSGIISMMRIQSETNKLLINHRERLGLDIDTCIILHSMSGEEVSPEICNMLGMSTMMGLERLSKEPIKLWEALVSLLDVKNDMIAQMTAVVEEARAHEPSFELDELWEEIHTAGSFCALMFDAAVSRSTITIT